ncbi:MAG: VCBS repeat-containing protein [Arcicella sp.]|nr:VCBS repeat-containing protein [Arcicella sp.]
MLFLSLFTSCQFNLSEKAVFKKIDSEDSGITFNNQIAAFEGDTINPSLYDAIYNGAGVGVGDFNKDGLQDLFFAGNVVSSQLYLNKGNFEFMNVTEKAKVQTNRWCVGVSVVDINQDGWLDIYVCVSGVENPSNPQKRANLLFINRGKLTKSSDNLSIPTFIEEAGKYGLADVGMSTQAAFFDFDHDDDLDCYVLTNAVEAVGRNRVRPKRIAGEGPSTDRLYINNSGNKTTQMPLFSLADSTKGIKKEGYGLGLAITDLNDDGWLDVYCANDFVSNDLLWINNASKTKTGFTDQAADYFKHTSFNSMGVDIQDFNNDTRPDVMVVDMLPETNERQKMMLIKTSWDYFDQARRQGYQDEYVRNTLQLNMGDNHFSEVGQLSGVHSTDWSWAPLLADFNNDGWKDLVVSNGFRRDITNLDYIIYLNTQASSFGTTTPETRKKALEDIRKLPEVKLHNYVFRNNKDLTFSDKSVEWGLEEPSYSNGTIYADLDNDGDLDLVFNNIDDPAGIYENQTITKEKSTENHFLRLRLPANAKGLGASVFVTFPDGTTQRVENHPVRGYASSVEPIVHVGLGKMTSAKIKISWADGTYQDLSNLSIDKTHSVKYQPNIEKITDNQMISFFVTTDFGINHIETPIGDFAKTPSLPHLLCKEGPSISVADVDGNGLEDVFVGADVNQTRTIFLQTKPNQFQSVVQGINPLKDVGTLFFDVDKDGDQDLYIVSGGSEYPDGSDAYQDRLYLNDGKGHFTRGINVLPQTTSSGSCVRAFDFDKDGDLDLFRGGRYKIGEFPMSPQSYLLLNDGTAQQPHFTDITQKIAPELANIGMVTDALWNDIDKDGNTDLMLCGEYMPITILKGNKNQPFTIQKIPNTNGLWNTLAQADLDGDGDVDFIAGNLGLNSRLKASENEPHRIYAKDFDKNDRIDPLMTHYSRGKEYLLPIRDVLTEQMTSLSRKRFNTYQQYAEATFEDALTSDERADVTILEVTELRTCWLENKGKDGFELHPLPTQAQIAPVYGMQMGDFNNDKIPDMILVGNSYAPETYTGWFDAGRGTLLLGVKNKEKKTFQFKAIDSKMSGLNLDKEARNIAPIMIGNERKYLITNHNGAVQLLTKSARH